MDVRQSTRKDKKVSMCRTICNNPTNSGLQDMFKAGYENRYLLTDLLTGYPPWTGCSS